MPIRRFRSVAEMPDERWREPGDPHLYRAIAQVWDFGRRSLPRHFPPGVHRYRTVADLDRAVEERTAADLDLRRRSR